MARPAVANIDETGAGGRATGSFARFKRFLEDVRTEMRKVNTPSRKEVRATTAVVLVTVFIFAAYFYGVDRIIQFCVDHILSWAQKA